ncbi:phosphoribosylanthranilate isomerase [Marasmitruncus massiliensis]|uniref:phosphoribosylanthranilate isomerase n=1 Tax=Marasmitruncus massiliensis TaxID=1944642 RepID=UPI000C7D01DE|nr:phosphoribosylanthranilate isomerase [Marasmitruncus massiliensis]
MTKVKICGLFRECDIDYVNEAMPDYIGFVFAKSPRQVSAETSKLLRNRLHPGIVPVGVFVNAEQEEILRLCAEHIIEMVQLHGQEDDLYIKALKSRTGVPVIKAVRMDAANTQRMLPSKADFLLLDSGKGGTGKAFDWGQIPAVSQPYFLAGGINETNIRAAVRMHPYCVDISSGAETGGVKDKNKILRLVREVREI